MCIIHDHTEIAYSSDFINQIIKNDTINLSSLITKLRQTVNIFDTNTTGLDIIEEFYS